MSLWRATLGLPVAASLALAACAPTRSLVQPGAEPALAAMPVAWKLEPPWREAQPRDASPKGAWWARLGDATLDALQQQALAANPSLALAQARLAQARSTVAAASAGLFPSLSLGSRANRLRITENRTLASYTGTNFSTVQNDLVASLSVNYELDLSGRVQGTLDAARAGAEQSQADLENTRLLLTADLAVAYISLRALDAELEVLAKAVDLQRSALAFVSTRHDLGVVSGLEVAQQQALLDSTLTQLDVLGRQRAQFEHAVATLVGQPAPVFSITPAAARFNLPAVPLGLPSDLLERRPDVASAQRAMAVANAQVGLARAAFFPSINLGGSVGDESRRLASLLSAPSLIWSVGVSATQVLFDGGRIQANVDFAQAGYQASTANYRRVVLLALQEVQDGISSVATLSHASAQADAAVQSAQRVLAMATGRYEGGISSYLDVITAQQALLAAQRQATQLQGQAQLSRVFLVKALGGDW